MGALCGYTESELTNIFSDRLDNVDIDTLRKWYNGYNFLGDERVYNPFDVLLFLKKRSTATTGLRVPRPRF